jgi:hypothetical protein
MHVAAHTALRSLVVVTGLSLIIVSIALDATIMLLPAGIAMGCAAAGIIAWASRGSVRIGERQSYSFDPQTKYGGGVFHDRRWPRSIHPVVRP